jgi:hypothetical protein
MFEDERALSLKAGNVWMVVEFLTEVCLIVV